MSNWKLGDPGLINVRGTNGTGKSTIVRSFITPNAIIKELPEFGCFYMDCGTHNVVGKYNSDCGGLDAVKGTADRGSDVGMKPYEAGQKAMIKLAQEKTTFAEGLIYGTTFQGSKEVYDALRAVGVPYYWLTINIPTEEIFNCVLKRRVSNGNLEPLNTANVSAKLRPLLACHMKAAADGVWNYMGSREGVKEQIEALLIGHNPASQVCNISQADLDAAREETAFWTDKGTISPTQEMIDKYAPKPTHHDLSSFFG